ncbi:phenylalanine--tRNA ligase beta subunit-related protein, partial [Staphylococcus epidermidis]|uniref:phenylalanine--tRNA ligase beta subunit-related protein n=1 Tax=Staphylococcus epidermidis TaxID=1282 RepID=UPI0037DA6071
MELKNQHKLPYYTTPLLHHLTIPPSPLSIHFPLIKPPIPPINNLLHISNYLLLQYPQPLHIFHQQQIPSQSIQLTQPKKHHTITTLHPQQPPFLHTHILITNPKHPIPLRPLIPRDFSQ